MRSERPRVLVLGHDAGRQGAPVVLLRFIEWLRAETRCDFELAFHQGGPLLDELARFGPTRVINPWLGSPGTLARIVRMMLSARSQDRLMAAMLKRRLQKNRYDLVWINSSATWRLLEAVSPIPTPRLLHFHELDYSVKRLEVPVSRISELADHFVAVSKAVREMLTDRFRVPDERVSVVYSCISEAPPGNIDSNDATSRPTIEGVGLEDCVVVGGGAASTHKGVDLLARLVSELDRRVEGKTTHMVWVGRCDPETRAMVSSDAARLGVDGRIHFTGEVDDPLSFFKLGEVFVFPSREDSLGLVCLEAAQCGLPTVCFDRAGGAPEFVEDDAGRVVPFLNVEAMARAIADLVANPDRRVRLGRRAKEKATSQFSVTQQGPRLLEVMEHLAGVHLT